MGDVQGYNQIPEMEIGLNLTYPLHTLSTLLPRR